MRGTCRRGSFARDLEGHGEEGSSDRHLSLWGPLWDAWVGVHSPGTLRVGGL